MINSGSHFLHLAICKTVFDVLIAGLEIGKGFKYNWSHRNGGEIESESSLTKMKVLKFFLFSHCCIGNWKGCHARVKIQEFKFPEIRNTRKRKCMPSRRNRVEIESESSSTKMRWVFKALHTSKKVHWLGGIERIVAVAKFRNELVEYLSRAMAVMLNVDMYTDTPYKNIGAMLCIFCHLRYHHHHHLYHP